MLAYGNTSFDDCLILIPHIFSLSFTYTYIPHKFYLSFTYPYTKLHTYTANIISSMKLI